MVKVTEEEKRILREKIEARKQRERYQENEMQLPDAYDIPEGKRVWEWVRRNIFWILSVIIGLFLLWCLFTFLIYGGYIPLPTHNFEKIYEKSSASYFQDNLYVEIGDDGSYMFIDSNPFDLSSVGFSVIAETGIEDIHSLMGVPDSVLVEMEQTNALSGRQTYEGSWFTISWTYHPDKGLEILYEKK